MNSNTKLSILVANFFRYLATYDSFSTNTKLSYKCDIKQFINFIEKRGVKTVKELNKDIVVKYFGQKDITNSPSTFRRNLSSVRFFLKFVKEKTNMGILPSARDVHTPKFIRKSRQTVSPLKINDLLDNISGDGFFTKRNRLIIMLMYTTGIRVSELCVLKISDIDLTEKSLLVNGESIRKITFSELFYSYLVDYLNERKNFLEESQTIYNEYLLFSNVGTKLTRQSIYLIVRKYSGDTHLKISPRTIRNSVLAHLIEEGADQEKLKEVFGYKSNLPDRSDFIKNDQGSFSVYILSNPMLRKK